MVWCAALLLGPAVAGGLTVLRGQVRGDHVALGLVLVVALVSAAGRPPAGLVAAATTGVAFDVFWTEPYGSIRVLDGGDVLTVVLLVVVGAAVEQISWWGARQQASASTRGGYLRTLERAADGGADEAAVRAAEKAIAEVLGVSRVRFVLDRRMSRTVLQANGTVTRSGRPWPVETEGLPVDDLISVPAPAPHHPEAHFAVAASAEWVRPTLEQRQVASLLARLAGGPAQPSARSARLGR